jgi:4-aminobutyrate aminotransferase-like enzyme
MGKSTEKLLQEVDQYLLPLPSYPPFIVKARGMTVEDNEGKTYLDFMAGPGVLNTGHCHSDIVEAVTQQIRTLTQCPGNTHNIESIDLAKKLAEITPGDLQKVFFCNSGAEAVEGAVKIAKKYASCNGKLGFGTVALEHSFHGRLSFSLSLTGMTGRKKGLSNFVHPGSYHIMAPYCYRCVLKYPSCDLYCAQCLENFFLTHLPADAVAAFICEPLMGVAGAIVPPEGYHQKIREICDRHGVLLIFDEVFAGFGRTGRMFAGEHFNVTPDIMTMAKGVGAGFPLGAVITTPKVGSAIEVGDNYTTYGWNNVVGLTAGLKGIEVIEKENLIKNAETVGAYFLDQLMETVETYPFLGEARGLGLFLGVEVVKDKTSRSPDADLVKRIKTGLMQRGHLIGVTGNYSCVIRITPPLIVTKDHVNQFIHSWKKTLDTLQ